MRIPRKYFLGILFFVPLFLLGTTLKEHNDPSRRQARKQILKFAEQYAQDASTILKGVKNYRFEKFLDETDTAGILDKFGTIVHESCHMLNWQIQKDYGKMEPVQGYFITTGVEIVVEESRVFNSRSLNQFVPDSLQDTIFRYGTYIGDPSASASKTEGIFGLMNEFTAYHQDTRASLDLFDLYHDYLANGFEKPEPWLRYIQEISGSAYALYEFRLFFSWYLQFAQKKHPGIYRSLRANVPLRATFTLTDSLFQVTVDEYYLRLDQIVEGLNKNEERVRIMDTEYGVSFRILKGSGSYGVGIHEEKVQLLKGLLEAPEHQILEEFKLSGIDLEHYPSLKPRQ